MTCRGRTRPRHTNKLGNDHHPRTRCASSPECPRARGPSPQDLAQTTGGPRERVSLCDHENDLRRKAASHLPAERSQRTRGRRLVSTPCGGRRRGPRAPLTRAAVKGASRHSALMALLPRVNAASRASETHCSKALGGGRYPRHASHTSQQEKQGHHFPW